jgi:hypothetical protein
MAAGCRPFAGYPKGTPRQRHHAPGHPARDGEPIEILIPPGGGHEVAPMVAGLVGHIETRVVVERWIHKDCKSGGCSSHGEAVGGEWLRPPQCALRTSR